MGTFQPFTFEGGNFSEHQYINGYRWGGKPVTDWYPVQGSCLYLKVFHHEKESRKEQPDGLVG